MVRKSGSLPQRKVDEIVLEAFFHVYLHVHEEPVLHLGERKGYIIRFEESFVVRVEISGSQI